MFDLDVRVSLSTSDVPYRRERLTPRVSQFPGAALVRTPRGHAGDERFVDLEA
jgi:hypothetical protein